MTDGLASGHRYCPKVDRLVSTSWTEGQCRDYNHCGGNDCPLEGELGDQRFERLLDLLNSSMPLLGTRPGWK